MKARPACGRGRSHGRGRGASSTRRHPSTFEIDPFEFPSSTAPARLSASTKASKRPAPASEDEDEDETQDCITIDILPEAQELVDVSLAGIATDKPPLTLSTAQVAIARGAGSTRDSYGTVRERAYMRAKSTIVERDMEDDTLDELASKDPVFGVDFDLLTPPATAPAAPARPQRSTRNMVDWSHLLSDNEDEEEDPLNDDPDFAFAWDV
jgi:hypothetical protein